MGIPASVAEVVVGQEVFDLARIAIHRPLFRATDFLDEAREPAYVEAGSCGTDVGVYDGSRLTDDEGPAALERY